MPGTFPGGNKENTEPLPFVPHGMSNKKRRRVDFGDETEDEADRSPKKRKADVPEGPMLMAPRLESRKVVPKTSTSSPGKTPVKKKGVLSMSRLNMLARPKMRR